MPLAANAADLPMRPAPVTPAAAVYNWTGFYVGLNGGGGWGRQDPLEVISGRFDRVSFDLRGGFIGGTMGAQIQQGAVVLGVEGDLAWADISGSGVVTPAILGVPLPITLSVANKIDALGTARIRFGMGMNNLLFYGTAGAAFLRESATGTRVAGVACGTAGVIVSCGESHWKPGLAVGLGTEYAFTPNWSVKGEYLYVVGVGTGVSKDNLNLLKLGANYKF